MQQVLKRRERVLLLKENKLRSLEKHPFGWFVKKKKKCISVCSLCWSVIRVGRKRKEEYLKAKIGSAGISTKHFI